MDPFPLILSPLENFTTIHLNTSTHSQVQLKTIPGAIIIFQTQTNRGTGFRLSFEVTLELDQDFSGMDYVYNNETGTQMEVPFWPYVSDPASPSPFNYNYLVITWDAHFISEPDYLLRLAVSEKFVGDQSLICFDEFSIYSLRNNTIQYED